MTSTSRASRRSAACAARRGVLLANQHPQAVTVSLCIASLAHLALSRSLAAAILARFSLGASLACFVASADARS